MINEDFINGLILGAAAGGNTNLINIDDHLSDTSLNPVQNKIIANAINNLFSKNGGDMFGNINMTGNNINDLNNLFLNHAIFNSGSLGLYMNSCALSGLKTPENDDDAANMKFVVDSIANALIVDTEEVIP